MPPVALFELCLIQPMFLTSHSTIQKFALDILVGGSRSGRESFTSASVSTENIVEGEPHAYQRFLYIPVVCMHLPSEALTQSSFTLILVQLGAMELRIVKPSFKYTAGQWLFVQIPEISRFQWHPFTITSAPEDPYVSVHIRQVGDWTRALGERLGVGPSVVAAMTSAAMKGFEKSEKNGTRGDFVELETTSTTSGLPAIRIDGPYGAPAEDVFKVEVAVLIGAGIGVTPFASILKHIWYMQKRGTLGTLRRVEFFWVCRDAPSFGWFQSLLQEVEAAQADPNFLRINIYLTQKIGEDMLWNIAVNDAGADYDPLTLLRTRTMFGRPDWMTIYGQMRQAIESGQYIPGSKSQLKTKVGTYFCGPGVLAKAIKEATVKNSSSNVKFTFAKVCDRIVSPTLSI
ncbi:hypothetical protein C0992_006540 [Termitomyces sp. T32_za158]|nr:hypothetical protein C0992_006540 [Termitomyces sp. T32_za158]